MRLQETVHFITVKKRRRASSIKKIAILVENLYDDRELLYPYYRLQEEGFTVELVGPEQNRIFKSKNGVPVRSDRASADVTADDYDALVVPGGFSPDYMRRTKATLEFTKAMHDSGKTIAAICHAPWLLISSIDLSGRKLAGFHTLKVDIENAGATYVDEEVVTDGNLITSRTPKDLPAFAKAVIQALR